MAEPVSIRVNDQQFRFALRNFSSAIQPRPLLQIASQVMRGSIAETFAEEGSPAGSWPALAPFTIRKLGAAAAGHKLLIMSGRLRNSITHVIEGSRLIIGTNLVYAGIHQFGGYAGRSSPSPRTLSRHSARQAKGFHGPVGFRRPFIPPRPYLVFRPEDPERMREGMEIYINAQARMAGL